MVMVVDASVALKWVIDEEGSVAARDLILTESLMSPDFMLVECANVIATKVRRGLLDASTAAAALEAIDATPVRFVRARPCPPGVGARRGASADGV